MTQQVNVSLILEVDATLSESQIRDALISLFNNNEDPTIDMISVESVKEEAEIYGNK